MKSLLYLTFAMMLIMVGLATCLNIQEAATKRVVKEQHVVTVTTYTTSVAQTDSSPLITASGFKLHPKNPRRQKVIAVSRDLMHKFKFGQYVKLEGAGELDGVYIVQDLMNKRFKKRIDVLINPKDRPTMYKRAMLTAL